MKDLTQQYFANMLRLRRIMIARFQTVSDTVGLSPSQGELLMVLLKAGSPQTTTALSGLMRTSPAAVSQQLDALEKLGCITRLPDQTDRRSTKVAIVDDNAKVLRLRAYLTDITKEMSDGLTESEINQMLTIQQKLITIFSKGES